MQDCLAIIDVQNDFVDGALGTAEARAMLPRLLERASAFKGRIVCTMDTHGEDYLSTPEGRALPVPHCIRGTKGWELVPALAELVRRTGAKVYEKPVFGSLKLAEDLAAAFRRGEIGSVELCGLCTDICVIANAVLLRTICPELPVSVSASCCAGVTPQKHQAALDVMASLQVKQA
jgi:nicotinamidase-related amidase